MQISQLEHQQIVIVLHSNHSVSNQQEKVVSQHLINAHLIQLQMQHQIVQDILVQMVYVKEMPLLRHVELENVKMELEQQMMLVTHINQDV